MPLSGADIQSDENSEALPELLTLWSTSFHTEDLFVIRAYPAGKEAFVELTVNRQPIPMPHGEPFVPISTTVPVRKYASCLKNL